MHVGGGSAIIGCGIHTNAFPPHHHAQLIARGTRLFSAWPEKGRGGGEMEMEMEKKKRSEGKKKMQYNEQRST